MADSIVKTGSIDRLIGDDALVLTLNETDKEVIGDGISKISQLMSDVDFSNGTIYKIVSKAQTGSIFNSKMKVDDFYYSPYGNEILADGDKLLYYEEKVLADAKSINLSFTSSEIDVTTLNDATKKYRSGKGDATGTIAFQVMISEMKKDSLYNKFFKIINIAKNGKQTVSEIFSKPLFIKGYLQKAAQGETQVFLLAQIELFGISLGADMGSAQEYTSNIRLNDADPVLFVVETLPEEQLSEVNITPDTVTDAQTNQGIEFTATANLSDVTYKWTGTNVNFNETNTQTVTATPKTAAECKVKVEASKNGMTVFDEVVFNATEALTSVNITGTDTISAGGTLSLTANPNTEQGVTYQWSSTANVTFNPANQKTTQATFNGGAGSATVKVKVTKGSISKEGTKQITVTGA